ncbi:hypothetical protein LTR84_004388 [Exophiala bonariae]|uniref:Tautomerase cis-CaaD-like domain-containing protein n=1 Tax=Exophiala bonariae TaxID=1690606 RepID=A0AAV9N8Q2_9EURO|nr:hypothetical protein LTR84_004388 [Exophiala bonariae]
MPLYDVEHITPLTEAQQASLAQAFTNLHSQRFATPKFFINVRYTDVSAQAVYRGGRKVEYNRVILRTRVGEQRTKDLYDDHCRDIVRIWEEQICCEGPGGGGGGDGAKDGLRTVWVLGALTTAVECGIARPRVGEEEEWLKINMEEFRNLARRGDEDFVELVRELDEVQS